MNQPELNYRLIEAAHDGDTIQVEYLLECGADINAIGRSGYTALDIANHYGYDDVLDVLYNYHPTIQTA